MDSSDTLQAEQQDIKSEAELSKLTKKDLVSLILKQQRKGLVEDRQHEWGHQFDVWLIRASRKERKIEILLTHSIGNSSENRVTAIPRRVDKDQVQFELEDGRGVWISKCFIITCAYSNNLALVK